MTREEVTAFLSWIRAKRPKLFMGMEEESAEILAEWQNRLEPFSKEEINQLLADGHYIPHFAYKPKMLDDMVKALEAKRGVDKAAERREALNRYAKAVERLTSISTYREPSATSKTEFDCDYCTDKDKQFCGGGICMRMLGENA